MKNFFLIIPFVLLLFNCNKNSTEIQETKYVIEINTDKVETFKLSNNTIYKNFVPLETTENSLIKRVDKIYLTDSVIIIFDESLREILLFNKDGSFFRKCGKKGNGPGEHTYFSDIYYDHKTELIYANEGNKKSMYIYNQKGNLIEVIPTPKIFFRSFCKVENGYWLYTGMPNKGTNKSVIYVDNNFNIINEFIPQKVFFTTYWRPTFFQNEKGENFFISPYGNIVYSIEKDELIPYFKIDFGKNSPPFEKIPIIKDVDEYDRLTKGDNLFGNIHNFVLYKDLFYFNFSTTLNNTLNYLGCFNKDIINTVIYDSYSVYKREGFPFKDITFIQPLTIYKGDYVCLVNPFQISEEDINIINKTSKFTISEDSNPLLFFLKNIE